MNSTEECVIRLRGGRRPLRCTIVLLATMLLLLCSPSAHPVSAQSGEQTHIVQPGESLSSIARRYGVSVRVLVARNAIANPDLIRSGQILYIPAGVGPLPTAIQRSPFNTDPPSPVATPTPQVQEQVAFSTPTPIATRPPAPGLFSAQGEPVHVVQAGDTLYGLGRRYGVSIAAIRQRNGLISSVIFVSQKLIIPLP